MPIGDDSALYKRQNIDELLTTHANAIVELRTAVQDLLPAAPVDGVAFDDIFLLRYILSFKQVDKATPPCRETLEWRVKNKDILHRLTSTGIDGIPNASTFLKFQTVGDISTTFQGWTTYVVRTAHSDLPSLMGAMSVQEVSDYLTYSKELQWREVDRLTRATGVLVKNISVIDLNGFSFFGADRRFFKALGDSSKVSAVVFPQLLGATICVNAPSFIQLLISSFGSLMPKSATDKQRFCKVKNTVTENASKCPFLNMFGGQDSEGKTCPIKGLPDFLGGVEPCPAVLVPVADRTDRMNKATISARSSKVVEIHVNEDTMMGMTFPCRIKWEVLVAGYGVGVGATMKLGGGGSNKESKDSKESKEKGEEVLPTRKIKADEGLVTGTFDVKNAGTLVITFDNSYSLLRSKTIQYRFDVDSDTVPVGVGSAMGGEGETKASDVTVAL